MGHFDWSITIRILEKHLPKIKRFYFPLVVHATLLYAAW